MSKNSRVENLPALERRAGAEREPSFFFFHFFLPFRYPAHWIAPSTFRVGLPYSI
jgi:hypothetical protein